MKAIFGLLFAYVHRFNTQWLCQVVEKSDLTVIIVVPQHNKDLNTCIDTNERTHIFKYMCIHVKSTTRIPSRLWNYTNDLYQQFIWAGIDFPGVSG